MSSQGIALLLASLPVLGIFGADKFYLGLYTQGIIMVILTITILGLFITIPWASLCSLFLVISILWGGKPYLYPSTVEWAPIKKTDKIIAWIVVGLTVLSMIVNIVYINSATTSKTEEDKQIPTPTPKSTPSPTPTPETYIEKAEQKETYTEKIGVM